MFALVAAAWAAGGPTAVAGSWYARTAHGPDFVDVRRFGAVGDGLHDDTRALQVGPSPPYREA